MSMKKKKSKLRRASDAYAQMMGGGYMAKGARQAAFEAGARWQKKQDIAAVKQAEKDMQELVSARLAHPDSMAGFHRAIAAIRKASK
jgi:L-fucose isomerase-like protein